MEIKDCHFRELLYKMCYIEGNVSQVVKDEFLSDENITGYIGYGYIDHKAGFTFETMACARKMGEDIIIYPGNDYMTYKNRIRNEMMKEVQILEEKDYDFSSFAKKIEKIHALYNEDEEINALRTISEIDSIRSNEFPDDALVTLYKEGIKPERAWFRLEGFNENYIQARLLHELTNSAYEMHEGDVRNLALMQDEKNTISLVYFAPSF